MSGPIDAPRTSQPAASGSGRHVPGGGKDPMLRWGLPAVIGLTGGILVAVVPWSAYILVFTLVGSGLAWVMRVASDWLVERAGPRRGVVLLGSVLFASWLIMAISPPASLRRSGFGPILTSDEPKDPYAIPPAGTGPNAPKIEDPDRPVDLVKPLRDLVTTEPAYTPPAPPQPPADGRQGIPRVGLRLSAGQSRFGEGVVMIADVVGDGRPVRGQVVFYVDGREVARRTLRVQGTGSQIEHRMVGLPIGAHSMRVEYVGTRTFAAAASDPVEHHVVRR